MVNAETLLAFLKAELPPGYKINPKCFELLGECLRLASFSIYENDKDTYSGYSLRVMNESLEKIIKLVPKRTGVEE